MWYDIFHEQEFRIRLCGVTKMFQDFFGWPIRPIMGDKSHKED